MTRSQRVLAVAVAALVGLAAAADAAQQYRIYSNARFGTNADVPADWKPDPPPENGDGLIFRSPDGSASVTVSGSLHVFDTIGEAMEIYEAPASGEAITYRHREPRLLVVSGMRGDTIFYAKHILSCRDQVWNNLHIEYPASQKAAYDAMVTHIARSLHSGRSGQIGSCR
ncbi:MAG TPA: hypothetical protein VGH49_07275 [Xanthobacteraceae bacterium]